MYTGPAYGVVAPSGSQAAFLTLALLQESQWYTVEPMPDGEYYVTVKAENEKLLDRLLLGYDVTITLRAPLDPCKTCDMDDAADPDPVEQATACANCQKRV